MLTETYFEQAIEQYLTTAGGYEKGNPQDYDRDRALFPKDIINFIQHTQPKFWERLSASNKGKAETILLDTLEKELQAKGMLDVLRHGFKCFGKTAYLVYFAPNTGMNQAQQRYNRNRLTITRQVKTASGKIPDVVLAINGLFNRSSLKLASRTVLGIVSPSHTHSGPSIKSFLNDGVFPD